jgi:putative nucleotidyltransferase with HDIG domain
LKEQGDLANNPGYSNSTTRAEILAILERANRIASMTSLDDLLDQMLELMIEVCGGNAGTLYLLDDEAGELEFKVLKGPQSSPHLVGKRIEKTRGIVGAAIRRATALVIEDLAADPRWYREIDPERTASLRNAITLPLMLQGRLIGAVQLFNFVTTELELLQVLGNRMASEVDKVLMLEKVRLSNQRLQKLVGMLGKIGATLDRDELLQLLTEEATRLLDAEKSAIFMVDPDIQEKSIRMVTNPAAGQMNRSSASLPLNQEDAHFSFQARSVAAAPLRTRPISVGKERTRREERVIGTVMAINKQRGNFDAEDTRLLEILASHSSTVLQVAELYAESNTLFMDFIKALAASIDAKDPYTRGHSQRVSNLSVAIATEIGLSPDQILDVRVGSLLHDIGKIGISDAIIRKPDHLTNDEYDEMKKHPAIGHRIISQVAMLQNVLPAISEHHERLDGTGYPFGLHGEQVSLLGRIVAVADVFDAMTTDRPYRKALDIEVVFDHLYSHIDIHFDGTCVNALLRAYRK